MMGALDLLELSIPPEPEYVGAARLFLTAAGRHYGLSEEVLADVKVAVSEVCSGAVEDGAAGPIWISLQPATEALQVEVGQGVDHLNINPDGQNPAGGEPISPANWEHELREALLQALFPNAEYNAAAHTLRLTVPWEDPEQSNSD
ncbi:MAG TPA: ATP-binding protein [Actinomycetota bacterium]|nr:ATP-binding protein [Actinomycetota bacterium]